MAVPGYSMGRNLSQRPLWARRQQSRPRGVEPRHRHALLSDESLFRVRAQPLFRLYMRDATGSWSCLSPGSRSPVYSRPCTAVCRSRVPVLLMVPHDSIITNAAGCARSTVKLSRTELWTFPRYFSAGSSKIYRKNSLREARARGFP